MQCMSLKVCLSHYLTKFIPSGWLSAVFIRNALCVVGDCKPVGVQPFWVYMSYMDGKFNCTLISVNILTETTKVIFQQRFSAREVCAGEICAPEVDAGEVCAPEVSAPEVDAPDVCASAVSKLSSSLALSLKAGDIASFMSCKSSCWLFIVSII